MHEPHHLDPEVYEHLHRLAHRIHGERGGAATLQPTALLHEAWMKVSKGASVYQDRAHFVAVAARAMRQILVDYARGQSAQKRGGVQHRTTLTGLSGDTANPVDVLALDAALSELASQRPLIAEVAALRLFGGLTVPEVAEALEVGASTVDRHWRTARAFLMMRLVPT